MANPNAKTSLQTKFEGFFRSKGIILWIILGLGVVVLVGIFVWNEIDKSIREQSTIQVEKAQESYNEWLSEVDDQRKAERENTLVETLNRLITDYPSRYAGQRALYMRANYFYEKKEWTNSARDYLDLQQSFPESILAPISIVNAAVCQEEDNKWQDAIKLHEKIVNEYANSYYIPYAMYSIARIYDMHEDFLNAKQWYTKLEDEYGQTSDWAKIGKNRMILLKAEGKIN